MAGIPGHGDASGDRHVTPYRLLTMNVQRAIIRILHILGTEYSTVVLSH